MNSRSNIINEQPGWGVAINTWGEWLTTNSSKTTHQAAGFAPTQEHAVLFLLAPDERVTYTSYDVMTI